MYKTFDSELGQLLNGQPPQKYACPEYIVALLEYLEHELWLNYEQDHSDRFASPFRNTSQKFKNDVFEVIAYDWSDNPQPYNFKYSDVKISWYKYLGRGTSINKKLSPAQAVRMFEACLESIR